MKIFKSRSVDFWGEIEKVVRYSESMKVLIK